VRRKESFSIGARASEQAARQVQREVQRRAGRQFVMDFTRSGDLCSWLRSRQMIWTFRPEFDSFVEKLVFKT
jgi:hypothetical protein